MDNSAKEHCPCKRVNCPRHGDCAACKEHHRKEKRKNKTCCEKQELKARKKAERQARKEQKDSSSDHPEKEKNTNMNKRFFIPACLLLAVGIGFVVFAAGHPECAFPWDIRITHGIYGLYASLIVLLFVLAFCRYITRLHVLALTAELGAIYFLVQSILRVMPDGRPNWYLPAALGLNCIALLLLNRIRQKRDERDTDSRTHIRNGNSIPMGARRAVPEDFGQITAFYRHVIDCTETMELYGRWIYGLHPTDEMIRSYIETGAMYLWEDGEEILSAAAITDQGEDYHQTEWARSLGDEEVTVVHLLCVAPELQGQGVARKTMEWILQDGKARGKKAVRLDALACNTPAHRLYQSLGFEKRDTKHWYACNVGWTDFYLYERTL